MTGEQKDIRWQQRLISFNNAFRQLERFLERGELNEMEEQGLIKSFEYAYELDWNTLQALLKEKGYMGITGPKPVIEQSFRDGYIENGKAWIHMHESRNLTSHTYDQETARDIIGEIRRVYFHLFQGTAPPP
ncbi:MAG: nucleotidyltransferase substrate binding protein [Bacteroidales bacterium]|nr:nucleotidyltransferase substrate binding protein [Bacteroidales bacterium]